MNQVQRYPLAQVYWDGEGSLRVDDDSGQRLLLLPIRFLRYGRVRRYSFVLQQLKNCYLEPGFLVNSESGETMSGDESVREGVVIYRHFGESASAHKRTLLSEYACPPPAVT